MFYGEMPEMAALIGAVIVIGSLAVDIAAGTRVKKV